MHEILLYMRELLSLTSEYAKILVHKSLEIMNYVKSHLPEHLKWPEFTHNINFEFVSKLNIIN